MQGASFSYVVRADRKQADFLVWRIMLFKFIAQHFFKHEPINITNFK